MIGTVGDVLNSSPTNLTKKGKCTGCGECCSNILPLSDAEIKRIKDYIKLNIGDYKSSRTITVPGYKFVKEEANE